MMDPVTVPTVPPSKGWKTWTGAIGLIAVALASSPLGLGAWDWSTVGGIVMGALTALGIGDKVQKLINQVTGK